METVRLKNGTEELKPAVAVTMMSLQHLMQTNPIAFYELVMKCRDNKHEIWGNTGKVLEDLGLVKGEQAQVHDTIRNIVLSAVSGEGFEMMLGSPVEVATAVAEKVDEVVNPDEE